MCENDNTLAYSLIQFGQKVICLTSLFYNTVTFLFLLTLVAKTCLILSEKKSVKAQYSNITYVYLYRKLKAVVAYRTPSWQCFVIGLPDCVRFVRIDISILSQDLICEQTRCQSIKSFKLSIVSSLTISFSYFYGA
jgi:hypothetical protein